MGSLFLCLATTTPPALDEGRKYRSCLPRSPQLQPRIELLFPSLARSRRRRLVQLKKLGPWHGHAGTSTTKQQGFLVVASFLSRVCGWRLLGCHRVAEALPASLQGDRREQNPPGRALPTANLAADDEARYATCFALPLGYPPGRAGGRETRVGLR